MRISDWSSDVCSSDLLLRRIAALQPRRRLAKGKDFPAVGALGQIDLDRDDAAGRDGERSFELAGAAIDRARSEEHTSELQSLMRISYAVFCLKKKKTTKPWMNIKLDLTNTHTQERIRKQ